MANHGTTGFVLLLYLLLPCTDDEVNIEYNKAC